MSLDYLTDVIILLLAAVILVPVSRLIRLGAVPGFLIAGILVGPSALGLIDNQAEIAHLGELGVVLLMFVIGIELKPSRLWLMRRQVFGLGALQVVVTGCLIAAAAYFLFDVQLRPAVLIGPALALSSTAFVLQLLTEQKMLTSGYGRTSIAVLLFQDLAVVPLLALASLLAIAPVTVEKDIVLALAEAFVILALIILGGRYLLQPILHRVALLGSPETFTASAVLLVMGTAVVMAKIGLSMAMGAFVAGLLVADSEFRHQVSAEIQPFRGLLIGLFFLSMGMSLELELLLAQPWFFIGLVILLMSVKAVVLWLLIRMFRLQGSIAWAVALLLAQSGEFALVLFSVAFDAALLSEGLFQQLLVVVVLSMLATPPLAGLAYRLATSKDSGKGQTEIEESALNERQEVNSLILILGFGRVGRRVGRIFDMRGVAYVAVDYNADLVRRERAAGRTVFYADVRKPEVLKSLGVGDAAMVIVTIDDFQDTEEVVTSMHQLFPSLNILAVGHSMEQCRALQALGARYVVSENLEASMALAQATLSQISADEDENASAIDRYRKNYYAGTHNSNDL